MRTCIVLKYCNPYYKKNYFVRKKEFLSILDNDIYDESIKNMGIDKYVNITDGHIPINEVENFFAACDLVVLPYESATQSGVIQVAYSFDKPVLATRVGGLPDVVFDGETGYLVEPFRPDLIASSIKDFFDNNREEDLSKGVQREKYRYSWERMEEVITELTGLCES